MLLATKYWQRQLCWFVQQKTLCNPHYRVEGPYNLNHYGLHFDFDKCLLRNCHFSFTKLNGWTHFKHFVPYLIKTQPFLTQLWAISHGFKCRKYMLPATGLLTMWWYQVHLKILHTNVRSIKRNSIAREHVYYFILIKFRFSRVMDKGNNKEIEIQFHLFWGEERQEVGWSVL